MSKPFEERFWSKVNKTEYCWEWIGFRDSNGYGTVNLPGSPTKKIRAHRASYQMHHGPIPDGMLICHSCDNPSCVRPTHLWAGTPKQNMDDMVAKGRSHNAAKDLVDSCVICGKQFKTRKNGKRGKQFCCSRSCAATFRNR